MLRNILLSTFLLLIGGLTLSAQQIYPVSVQGTLVPPHSLVLSDYGFDKADDLLFFVSLNDPVEVTRMVKFRLTVQQDGQDIMQTDPNFIPTPYVLERLSPAMITGADLAPYLDAKNLLSANGENGGNLLPEGFISFCLEVIDIERQIPISDRICASGFFELTQPPILDLPFCEAEIPLTQIENLLFKWTPMDLLSLNRPMDVRYEFTLVKLLPGIQDPNDGFNFSTPVLQEEVSQALLQYLEFQPLLESGARYAWRVRAFSPQGGENLFKNGGYSQVCTFSVFDDTEIPTGGDAPIDKPKDSFSCLGGDCEWEGDLSTKAMTGSLAKGDLVQLGHFELELNEVNAIGQNSYSGTGSIYIPFLYSKVKVSFEELKVNEEKRVYEGVVLSETADNKLVPSFFAASNVEALKTLGETFGTAALADFKADKAKNLVAYFKDRSAENKGNVVSQLRAIQQKNAPEISMPIGIDQEILGTDRTQTIAVTGIRFTPKQATLNAVLVTQAADNSEEYIKFGGKDFCIQPSGLAAANPTLSLLADITLDGAGLPIKILAATEDTLGTHLAWNCDGFEKFVLKGNYTFDNQTIRPKSDKNGNVVATFEATTKRLDDFMVKVDGITEFVVNGAADFPFTINEAWLDFSLNENPTGLTFPENYPASDSLNAFRGFYLSQAKVALPKAFQLSTTNGTVPSLAAKSLLFDKSGLTGKAQAEQLISLTTGDLGGWAYSLDSMWLNVTANSFTNSGFQGAMRLPIMKETESLNYIGSIQPSKNVSDTAQTTDILFKIKPEVVTIDLLRSKITFDEQSEIVVGRIDGKFQAPRAELSGLISANISENDTGFNRANNDITQLKAFLNKPELGDLVPNFNFSGIRFNGLVIDMAAKNTFQIDNLEPQNTNLEFLGLESQLTEIGFKRLRNSDFPKMALVQRPDTLFRAIQFNMDFAKNVLGPLAPSVVFSVLIAEDTLTKNRNPYAFAGFDLQYKTISVPDLACQDVAITEQTNPTVTKTTFSAGDEIKVGDFVVNVIGTNAGEFDLAFLNTTLKVTWEDIGVNSDGELVQGNILTVQDETLFADKLIPVNEGSIRLPLIAKMNEVAEEVFQLPFSMRAQVQKAVGSTEKIPYDFVVVGMRLSPKGAKLDAAILFDENNPLGYPTFKLGVTGLNFTPSSISLNEVKVFLTEAVELNDFELPFTILPGKAGSEEGSYVTFTCEGFKNFHLQARHDFDREWIVPADEKAGEVGAYFSIETTDFKQFMATVDSIDRFAVKGFEDVVFKVEEATLDYSDTQNPDGFLKDSTKLWRGFFLKTASVELPNAFSKSNGDVITIAAENFIYKKGDGLTGNVVSNNTIVNFGESDMDGWQYSLDKINLSIVKSSFEKFSLEGEIHIPILDEKDRIAYETKISRAKIIATDTGQAQGIAPTNSQSGKSGKSRLQIELVLNVNTDAEFGIPFLGEDTKLILKAGSVAGVKYGDKKFEPYTDLSGDFKVKLAKSSIVPFEFELPSLGFEHFKLNDPDLEAGRQSGKTGGLDRMSIAAFSFLGKRFVMPSSTNGGGENRPAPKKQVASSTRKKGKDPKLVGFNINVDNITFTTNNSQPRLGFDLTVNFSKGKKGVTGTAGLGINGKIDFTKLRSEPWNSFTLTTPDIDKIFVAADFDEIRIEGGLKLIKNDPKYGDGFKGALKLSVLKKFTVDALAQFGTTKFDADKTAASHADVYPYFFVDALATFATGIPVPPLAINGFGGGIFYNMLQETAPNKFTGDIKDSGKLVNKQKGDKVKVAALQIPNGDTRLTPGYTLSGAKYGPSEGKMALKATIMASLPKPESFLMDATLGFAFNLKTESLEKVSIDGSAYILSPSLAERNKAAITGKLGLVLDKDRITGDLQIDASNDFMELHNKASMFFDFAGNKEWRVTLGTPKNPWGIQFKIPGTNIGLGTFQGYFMAGHGLGLPEFQPKPLTEILGTNDADVANSSLPRRNNNILSTGAGFAFGAGLTIPKNQYKFLFFRARAQGGVGFDVSMMQFAKADCGNGIGNIGINKWYLNGRMYAYFEIGVDVGIDLWFWEGWINIFDVSAFLNLRAQLPNPSWVKGTFVGRYSVMGGLARGKVKFEIEAGERCADLGPTANPLDDINVIDEFYPENDADPIEVYEDLRATFTIPMNKVLSFDVTDNEGVTTPLQYHPYVSRFNVRNNKTGAYLVDAEASYKNFGNAMTFTPRNPFDARTSYTATISIKFKNLTDPTKAEKLKAYTYKFTTGDRPKTMVKSMLSYHAPGHLQRYWHKDYAYGKLLFKHAGWQDLFAPVKQIVPKKASEIDKFQSIGVTPGPFQGLIEGFANWLNSFKEDYVAYDWKVRLTNLFNKKVTYIPITEYPGQKEIERFIIKHKKLGDREYKIPYVAIEKDKGKEVKFNGINDLVLQKGAIYRIEIVGLPQIEEYEQDLLLLTGNKEVKVQNKSATTAIADKQISSKDYDGKDLGGSTVAYTVETVSQKLGQPLKLPFQEEKILYSYEFAVSRFNSLEEKLESAINNPYHSQHDGISRKDIGHPDKALPNFAKGTYVADQFHIFINRKNGQEGFDYYDQIRLRQNLYPIHDYYDNQHPFEKYVYGYGIFDQEDKEVYKAYKHIKILMKNKGYSIWKNVTVGRDKKQTGEFDTGEFVDNGLKRYYEVDKWGFDIKFTEQREYLEEDEIDEGAIRTVWSPGRHVDGLSIVESNFRTFHFALVDSRSRILNVQAANVGFYASIFQKYRRLNGFWKDVENHWLTGNDGKMFENWKKYYKDPTKFKTILFPGVEAANPFFDFYFDKFRHGDQSYHRKELSEMPLLLSYFKQKWNTIGDKAPRKPNAGTAREKKFMIKQNNLKR